MTNHPITPPPELVREWMTEIWHEGTPVRVAASDLHIATQAARWGADQELEASCEQLRSLGPGPRTIDNLRAARRPKPKSQAEEALEALEAEDSRRLWSSKTEKRFDTIRAALERLRELEGDND